MEGQELNKMPSGVLYQPGQEPEQIRQRIEILFAKLDEAYPDKVIVGLHKEHKKWGETVTDLYRKLGYPDGNSFLQAYGYTTGSLSSGRPSLDPVAIIGRLKELYPDGTDLSIQELQTARPEIPWKSLQNKSKEYFGMTLTRYLAQEGILTSGRGLAPVGVKDENQMEELIATLEKRYEGKEKPDEFKTLIADNPDLPLANLNKVTSKLFGETAAVFLKKKGILQGVAGISDEEKLAEIEKALLEKYSGETTLPQTLEQIKRENSELKLSNLNSLTASVKGVTAKDYLTSLRVLQAEEDPKDVLAGIVAELKERYVGAGKRKAYTISDLKIQNPDLPISSLKKLVQNVHKKTQTEYLKEQGILSEPEWMIAARLEQERITTLKEEQRARFKNDLPLNELLQFYSDSYVRQTRDNPYYNIEIPKQEPVQKESSYSDDQLGKTQETTEDGFVIRRGKREGKPYIELYKYTGSEEIVKVPEYVTTIWNLDTPFTSTNIKQILIPPSVTGINVRTFSKEVLQNIADKEGFCIAGGYLVKYMGQASAVTIPEGVEEITDCAFAGNNAITTVYMPKSIRVIGYQAFSGCGNLSAVVFSDETESLDRIEYEAFSKCNSLHTINLPKKIKQIEHAAFSQCSIPKNENGFETVENVLIHYFGSEEKVTVPEGITVIAPRAFDFSRPTSVVLPEGVVSIGERAFNMVKTLRKIQLPSTLTVVEGSAFSLCENLSEINLEHVTYIGNEAFKYCYQLEKVILSDELKEMGYEAFSGCPKLQNILVKSANGIMTNRIPGSLSAVPAKAFKECTSLEEISVPGTVRVLDTDAFAGCTALRQVVLEEGIEEIGNNAFNNTESLNSLNIPSSVTAIGKDAFFRCHCCKSIELPEALKDKKGFYGIPDENNCFVENGILKKIFFDNASELTVSDGVVVIDADSLNQAFSLWGRPNVEKIHLPDTVRVIRQEEFGHSRNVTMNIPYGYLLQKTKLPAVPLKNLLSSVWKYDASMLDWVSVFLYQNSKQLNEECVRAFAIAPNVFVAASLAIFSYGCTTKEIERATEVVYDLREDISQEFLDAFYSLAKEKKNQKAVSALTPFASATAGGELNAVKTYQNAEEEFCDKNFEKHEFERIMQKARLQESDFERTGVKYLDREEDVSAFVLECAVVPYIGQMEEKPRNIGSYKTDFCRFDFLEKCDEVASHFEKTTFLAFLQRLSTKAGGYERPQIWIPVCRFGTGDMVKALISSFSGWSQWYSAAANGRSGIMVCRGAIMLSDTREAMMYAEKCKRLDYYARLRGTSEETIRDTKLADFGFNENGKKIYDTGNTVIEASIGDDLSIFLYDTVAGKIVKSIPKRGADAALYDACQADYAELRKNVKKVVKSRNDLLFEYFLSGKSFQASAWIAAYTENPVLNKVARLLVWSQGKATFTLSDSGAVDSFGNPYEISAGGRITVAHPLEMEDADISRWQGYFTARGLKQPFEQIWEPKIDSNSIKPDRYQGCMIPYYRFLHQEKHGIDVQDYDFHNEIYISLDGCNAEINRIDWARHSIDVKDRFEIKSFSIKTMNRQANHIVYYLDKCTIYGRIEQDDESVLNGIQGYTAAQIASFLDYAVEKGSVKCAAILLEYKNEHFGAFADMDRFTLEL